MQFFLYKFLVMNTSELKHNDEMSDWDKGQTYVCLSLCVYIYKHLSNFLFYICMHVYKS